MRGSGCATAASAESNAWSGSYTTLMRSSAAVAVSSVVAATAATGSPMKRTLSTQSACSSCETGKIPNGIGRSGPVSTACTPSSCCAAVTSIETMRACGWVLRSSLQYSMRGNARSSANRVAPVTFATASTFRSAFPMTLCLAIQRFPLRLGFFTTHARRGQLDRLIDLDVAGAAAEVAGQRVFDFGACRLGIAGEQRLGGEQESGRAVAALRGAQVGERLLQGMQLAALRHRFDGSHRVAGARETQHQARQDRRSIQQHGARTALAQLAAVLRSGESQVLAQYLEQRLMRCERHFSRFAVHGERDFDF